MSSISEIKKLIDSAEASLKSARKLLLELSPEAMDKHSSGSGIGISPMESHEEGKVVEGVFDGERMTASDGESYPVPANYASKSKLVSGDHLKLTILNDGRFVYKQIGPVPRKTLIGTLVHADGQFRVIAEGKSYKVLLASVTYYKAHIGDRITIIISEAEDSEWAAIEAVLPKDVRKLNVTDEEPEKEEEVDF